MSYRKKSDGPSTNGKGQRITDKMARFIDEYMVDLNASQACIRAGYKTKNPNRVGPEIRNHPLVAAEIEKRMAYKQERNEVTADYVLDKLMAIVEATDKSNPQAALRGLELLGKNLGLFKDRQEISGPDGEAIKMEQKVKENAADFTSKLAQLVKRNGEGNVVKLSDGRGES